MFLAVIISALAMTMPFPQSGTAEEVRYLVGAKDILEIKVYDEQDLSKEAIVDHGGRISFPLLGSINVGGLSTVEIEELLERQLGEKYLVDPQVFVSVKEYNSRKAVVLGVVKNPGPYALTGETTILDLISRAGGLLETGGKNIVLVRRGNRYDRGTTNSTEEPIVIDANKLLRLGEKSLNYVVYDGDMVFAPKADGVYVYGEVKKPGVVAYRDGLTVLQAISLAEGLSGRASAGSVRIIRSVNGKEQKIKVNLDDIADNKRSDVQLRPEDVIVVPESFF
jgi:polysaccharide export outer membrane protein